MQGHQHEHETKVKAWFNSLWKWQSSTCPKDSWTCKGYRITKKSARCTTWENRCTPLQPAAQNNKRRGFIWSFSRPVNNLGAKEWSGKTSWVDLLLLVDGSGYSHITEDHDNQPMIILVLDAENPHNDTTIYQSGTRQPKDIRRPLTRLQLVRCFVETIMMWFMVSSNYQNWYSDTNGS